MDILVQIVQVLYVLITVVLILVVLLQAGRGGGLGTALGGGASQSVFGGSGGADFLAKLTQGLAVGFMICAVYLAYASAHSGSSRLQEESKKNTGDELLADDDEAVDY
jgi:preprotein translocase subunit SecG